MARAHGIIGIMLGCGCASSALPPSEHMVDAHAADGRPLCGWEQLSAGDAALELSAADAEASVAPGAIRATLVVADDVPFATVRRALAPARESLVRIKIAFDGRWLLPLTNPARQPPKPPPDQRVEAIVGHRRITRSKSAPRTRIADLRVDRDRLRLFVENDHPAGHGMAVSELRAALARIDPPVQTFAITATAATPWRHLATALSAAACYDRGPGEEPHEIVLD